jgi:hypothetical protein
MNKPLSQLLAVTFSKYNKMIIKGGPESKRFKKVSANLTQLRIKLSTLSVENKMVLISFP